MINTNKLQEIIQDQLETFTLKKLGTSRRIDFASYKKSEHIVVISGIRRTGKSTLLRQFASQYKNFYYANFDDERFVNFDIKDFQELLICWQKKYESKIVFLDEIQNILGWEKFVRRLHDEGYKVFITGSNAKLLSSELSTHLTGRYLKIELYPFSFLEYLDFYKCSPILNSSKTKIQIIKHFDNYLKNGSFPEFLVYKNPEFLKRIYEDVIYKDIISRFGIRETKSFRQLTNFLFTNFTKEINYSSIAKTLGIKTAKSVSDYISFLQQSYMVFEIFKYDFSLKKQFISDKKIYTIDNGLRNEVSFFVMDDMAKMLENLVFIQLKRKQKEIYFFKDTKECDFLCIEKNSITDLIQVSIELNETSRDREINGLSQAMKTLHKNKGLILTYNQEETIKTEYGTIEVLPVYKRLL